MILGLGLCCLFYSLRILKKTGDGSDCGTVDSAVAYETRGPGFESSHRQLLSNIYLFTVNDCFQCDQIWQIFTTLAKYYESLAFFEVFLIFGKIGNLLRQLFTLLDKISLLCRAKYCKNNEAILSH